MDSESWRERLASASRRYQLDFLSRSDSFLGFEEVEEEDDLKEEHACPFCSDYFDIVSLCCHIDEEHPSDAENGVCPVCSVKLCSDMVAHITLEHSDLFKVTRKRKTRSVAPGGAQSMLKREFPNSNFRSLFEGLSRDATSSNIAADPLLSSFISPMVDDFLISESAETSSAEKTLDQCLPEPILSVEDHRKKLKQSEFVQDILSSAILHGVFS